MVNKNIVATAAVKAIIWARDYRQWLCARWPVGCGMILRWEFLAAYSDDIILVGPIMFLASYSVTDRPTGRSVHWQVSAQTTYFICHYFDDGRQHLFSARGSWIDIIKRRLFVAFPPFNNFNSQKHINVWNTNYLVAFRFSNSCNNPLHRWDMTSSAH